MDRRFTNQQFTEARGSQNQRLTKSWCTGKDSNLRTSLGGTDLQSVGFNHSPTCAKTFGRCGCCASSSRLHQTGAARTHTRNPPAKRSTAFYFATQGNQGSRKTPRRSLTVFIVDQDHCTPEKYRLECVGKTCCAANRVRRLPDKTFTGAGEGI